MTSSSLLQRAAPALFVVIWSTGFIVARLIAPHAEPLSFLCLRYVGSVLVFVMLALVSGAAWPATPRAWAEAAVAGVLLQGLYLGCVFWSVRHGLPAGIAALITAMQPILTGLVAGPLLKEQVSAGRWAGLAAGAVGVGLVLWPKIGIDGGVPVVAALVCFVATIAVTFGTIWQKSTASGADLRTNAAIQFAAALLVTFPIAAATESFSFDGTTTAWLALAWAVLGLSTGGILLLLGLIKSGAVAGVSALFYLVPPVSALMAYALFGEALVPLQILGMTIAVAGVALARR